MEEKERKKKEEAMVKESLLMIPSISQHRSAATAPGMLNDLIQTSRVSAECRLKNLRLRDTELISPASLS